MELGSFSWLHPLFLPPPLLLGSHLLCALYPSNSAPTPPRGWPDVKILRRKPPSQACFPHFLGSRVVPGLSHAQRSLQGGQQGAQAAHPPLAPGQRC